MNSAKLQTLSFFILLAPAACLMVFFAGKGFAGLGGAAGAIAITIILLRRQVAMVLALPSSQLLLAWICLGLLSATWSLDAANSLDTMQGLSGMLIAALCLLGLAQTMPEASDAAKRRFAWVLVGSFLLLTGLLLLDQATQGGVYRATIGWLKRRNDWIPNINIRAGVFVTLLVWPVMLAAYWATRRLWLPLIVFIIGAIAAYVSPQVTAKLAFGGGVVAFALVWLGGRRMSLLLGLAICLAVVTLPFLLGSRFDADYVLERYPALHYSAKHRLHVWDFVIDRYFERPWLGWGIDAARLLPGGSALLPSGGEQVPSHPHNGILQFWLELGVLGGLLLAIGQFTIWRSISNAALTPMARALAAAAFITALGYFLVSFNSWHSWWVGLLGASFSLLIAALRSFGQQPR